MARRKWRVLVLMHTELVPPDTLEGKSKKDIATWRTEYDVVSTLRESGHEVRVLGVHDELRAIRDEIDEFNPHITFNLLEEFHGVAAYNYSVVSYLELLRRPYTGCNPRGLLLARDKALAKKILAYHRILVPRFAVVPIGRRVRRHRRLEFPLIVKTLNEEASLGISQASLVTSDERLADRVDFIHDSIGADALIEEYIEGRELYVGLVGNLRLQTLPIWELDFGTLPDGAPRIATARIKWSEEYQKRIGLKTGPVATLDADLAKRINHLCRRTYRCLGLSGCARVDIRLTADGRAYMLEANPNPELSAKEDFAASATAAGLPYDRLLERLIRLGLSYRPMWQQNE